MHTQSIFFSHIFKGLLFALLILSTNFSYASSFLYEQTPFDPFLGFQSDSALFGANGDDFKLNNNVSIDSITWWGRYIGTETPDNDNFIVKIFQQLSEIPNSNPGFAGSVSYEKLANQDYYRYQLLLNDPLKLIAGDYFISIQNDLPIDLNSTPSQWEWLFGDGVKANGKTIYYFYTSGNNTWSEDDFSGVDMAFSLEGSRNQTIPEPNTLVLLLLGSSLLIIARKGIKNTLRA